MKKSKIIVVGVILTTVFTTTAQAYSGADFGNDVINVIKDAWQFWKDNFWIE